MLSRGRYDFVNETGVSGSQYGTTDLDGGLRQGHYAIGGQDGRAGSLENYGDDTYD